MTSAFAAYSQQTIPLYEKNIPNSKTAPDQEQTTNGNGIVLTSKISRPTLTVYLAPQPDASGTAVVICPGGGYWVNAIEHEGSAVAKAFNAMGITAFVLKYRIPDDATMVDKTIGPLQDVQQALAVVRIRAREWKIDPAHIGLMGFSAGGHLASTAGTHFSKPVIDKPADIPVRPDFLMLIYPVISFDDSFGHRGSRDQLLGKTPTAAQVKLYSNELQVTANTPPTFLVHASDDDVVPVQNSLVFYQQLVKNSVPAAMHLYQAGGHGFGMHNKTTSDAWMDRCKEWLMANGWLTSKTNQHE